MMYINPLEHLALMRQYHNGSYRNRCQGAKLNEFYFRIGIKPTGACNLTAGETTHEDLVYRWGRKVEWKLF